MGLAQILKQPHSTLVKNPKAFTFKLTKVKKRGFIC
jgi:hypothetical protein